MTDTDRIYELMRTDIRNEMMKKEEKYETIKKDEEQNKYYKIMNSDKSFEAEKNYKTDKKYVKVRKSVLICGLFSFVMVITFLTVLVVKLLVEIKSENASNISEDPNNNSDIITTYTVGSIKTITTQKESIKTITTKGTTITTTVLEPYTTSILEQATTTLEKPTQTPSIVENRGGFDNVNEIIYSNAIFRNQKDVMVSWKINLKDELKTNLEIKNINNKLRRDQYINKTEGFAIDNDLTMNLTLELKRIFEIGGVQDVQNIQNVQNELIISPETEIRIEENIEDSSKNVGGGIIKLKRVFSSQDGKKQVEVEQRLHICSKCTSQLRVIDPEKMLYIINIKKWDYMYEEPIIKFEFEVTSSKPYWSNENLKVVNFDKGQCLLNYYSIENSMDAGFSLPISIEKIKDVYTTEVKSLLVLEMFMANNPNSITDPNLMMPKPEDKAVFTLQSNMDNYYLLDTILSSSISTSSGVSILNHNKYYLWFLTFIISAFHFFIFIK